MQLLFYSKDKIIILTNMTIEEHISGFITTYIYFFYFLYNLYYFKILFGLFLHAWFY